MTWCWQLKHPLEPDLLSSLICLSLHTACEMQCSQDFSSACGSCWQRLFQFIQVNWFILGNQYHLVSKSFSFSFWTSQFKKSADIPVVCSPKSCFRCTWMIGVILCHREFNIAYLICPFESLRFSVLAVSNPSSEFGWIYKPLRFILSNSFPQLMSQHS